MNLIFIVIILSSMGIMLFISPDLVLSSMLNGGQKALELSLKLVVIYAVFMGITSLADKSGLSKGLAKGISPLNNYLFGKLPDKAGEYVSMNISANILGLSGATTPMGILAVKELEKHPNTAYQIAMFFVINATSIQLIPTSVLALRTSLGAVNPSDITLPTILATLLSTILGIIMVKIFIKKDCVKNTKTQGKFRRKRFTNK